MTTPQTGDDTPTPAARALPALNALVLDAMARQGMSRSDLASRLGISYQAVHSWTQGTSVPGLDTCRKLVGILGLDFAQMVLLRAGASEPGGAL